MNHDSGAQRLLLVHVPALETRHRARIAREANQRGFVAQFEDDPAAAATAAPRAEIIFSQNPELARGAVHLRWFATPSAGVDAFWASDALGPRVPLTNSSGAYGVTIAEHIVMVTLMLMRRQLDYAGVVARREWVRALPVCSIRSARITLLGAGDIAREAAIRLKAFSPERIVAVNRTGTGREGAFDVLEPMSRLDALLPETDLLVAALPGTPETENLLDARRLSLLPDGAAIVNVGRGSLIDARALEAELRAGRLCAALDVFRTEPLSQTDSLWTCPNLLITPHVAGNMTLPYTRDAIVELFCDNLSRYAEGRPLARVANRTRGY